MRKRPFMVISYYNEEEYNVLCKLCDKLKLGKSTLIRYLILGYKPLIPPPIEYKQLIREMRMIGNNINQLIVIARSNGILNTAQLEEHITALDHIEDKMREAFDFKKRDNRWQ